ncbi:NAD(P)/FAD-dependent oxidoreductase [Ectothiorhodospiraceae bacterium WFHF3C12]|nr:NAD(P)/FAD-dependent oxidoreductase [Ectothiorhodospiraceae bacterium WFHF3C12]
MKAAEEQGTTAGRAQRLLTPAHFQQTEPVIVIGTGPAGMRAAQEVLAASPDTPVRIFGEEAWPPYNRVQLSAVLAGTTNLEGVTLNLPPEHADRVEHISGRRINAIDRRSRQVIDADGHRHGYSRLVLATGSRALLPLVPGMELDGVFTFRNMEDARQLAARRGARHIVVLGGGLLGMEAARGMLAPGSEVTVIEAAARLMPRQLDEEAAERLRASAESLGIDVKIGQGVSAVEGRHQVEYVRLVGGERLPCDVLVVAAGVAPNVDLAKESGLAVGRGIRVNDRMQTSDPFIYAVGECVEHDGRLYGLAGPGLEQARVAALAVAGREARYRGSCDATKLKLFDQLVFSAGRVTNEDLLQGDRVSTFAGEDGGYRRLVTRRGRLVGAEAFGDWDEAPRLPDLVRKGKRVWPWQRWRFVRTGRLLRGGAGSVASWPEEATVCNCMGVNRGTLSAACQAGADCASTLALATGAGTVCGSCRPLLQELAGEPAEKDRSRLPLAAFSALAMAITLVIAFQAPLPATESVQPAFQLQTLWEDGLLKQVTGFTLVGLAAVALLMSARKRIGRFRKGGYPAWRVFHAGLGAATIAVLIAHTGLSLGDNLNRLLMLDFLALSGAGAAAGAVFAVARPLRVRARRWSAWAHILLGWPLPALLGFHVLSVYYF